MQGQTGSMQMGSGVGVTKLSVLFALMLAVAAAYLLVWGIEYIHHQNTLLYILAVMFGLFMAFNVGGNDVANSFGTSVGAGTLTIKQALLIAAIFEVSGAVLAGGEVTNTIRGGIVDLKGIDVMLIDFVYIMMSALLAAGLWLLFATKKGYPVSTTHSIVGGVVGSSITLGFLLSGMDSALELVQWDKILQIAISWVVSPVLGGLVSYILFSHIKKHVLLFNDEMQDRIKKIRQDKVAHKKEHKEAFERLSEIQQIAYTQAMTRDLQVMHDHDFHPDELETDFYKKMHDINQQRESLHATRALETWVPMIAALGTLVIGSMLLFKGLKNLDLGLSTLHNYLILAMLASSVWMSTFIFAKTLKGTSLDKSTYLLFSWMQVFTAAGFAFSHGSNDIANAIGPFAAILDVLRTGDMAGSKAPIPPIAMISFGVALVAGLWFIGKEVIATVGHNLTKMHPASGFSAELAAASVIMLASIIGIPVSSTHILIGAVLGIGLVNKQTNWKLMKPIGLAWIITLPAAGILSGVTFVVLRQMFS